MHARVLLSRIAFYGRVVRTFSAGPHPQLLSLRVFKPKQREGVVERVEGDGCTAICRGMFQKDTDLARFEGRAGVEEVGGGSVVPLVVACAGGAVGFGRHGGLPRRSAPLTNLLWEGHSWGLDWLHQSP